MREKERMRESASERRRRRMRRRIGKIIRLREGIALQWGHGRGHGL